MTEWILNLDREIVLGLNALHTPVWDSIMLFLSSRTAWIPLYVIIAALMFVPKWYGKHSSAFRCGSRLPIWAIGLTGVLAVLLCFGITDQLTNIVKDAVQRLRPSHDPLLEGMLALPEGPGGLYGFFSAHAANTFGLAVLTSLIFRRKWYSVAIVLWAAAVGFSRIYLARHFTTDVICGAVFGTAVAFIIYSLYAYVFSLLYRHRH
ncbi:MAG TPA: phosphatase PAP2 family protein [Candidatus Coprenecus pullistercoris]|nr:phosphatase PAP2 family protein [Candidatus Coprenecus pullistercoris]